eukprot:10760380-Alexandrium_andersonii.AAC.1
MADWRIADWSSRAREFAPSDPLKHRTHTSGASGTRFEACSWARAVQAPNASSVFAHVREGRSR